MVAPYSTGEDGVHALVKNLELWQQLEELLDRMPSVEVFYVIEHEYSLRMFNEMGWRLDEYV